MPGLCKSVNYTITYPFPASWLFQIKQHEPVQTIIYRWNFNCLVCNKKGYVLHFFPLFTSPGNSREGAALTCEHIIVAVDFVQLKSFIKFMELVWIQHLTLPVGIACKANTRSFFQRWIFCFRSHMIHVEGPHQTSAPGGIFTSSPVKCCCWTVYVLTSP